MACREECSGRGLTRNAACPPLNLPACTPVHSPTRLLACVHTLLISSHPTSACLQDRVDDERVGVKSTARLFAHHSRPILGAFSAATIGGLTLAGHAAGLGG